MDVTNKTKTILIIDDDLNIRLVIKKLLSSLGIQSRIYTSDKGIEGLGLAYIIKPDIIILDTTLPKYSGREIIDFIITNKIFQDSKIIVLHQDNDISNLNDLGPNYFILSKKAKDFPNSLIDIMRLLENVPPVEENRRHKLSLFMSKKVASFANLSDINAQKTNTANNIIARTINAVGFIINQIFTGVYLTLFLILMGREKGEENSINNRQELQVYRSRVYPAFAFGIATTAIIIFEVVAILSSFLGSTILFKPPVYAAAKVWDGGGGVATGWSTCTNWDLNVCPAAGDTVTFNATSVTNTVVDASFAGTIASLTIASGYTHSITLSRSLTITGAFSQAAGTFSAAGQTMSVGTTFSLTAGAFTASSGTISVASTFTISGSPTFTHNSGTFDFTGAAATLTCNSVTFNAVNFIGQTGVKTVSSGCTLPLGAAPTIPNGISLSGTLSGTGTITNTTGTLTINSGGSLSGFSGLTGTTNDLIVSGATVNFSTYNPVFIGGIFTVTVSGAFTAPSGTMSVGGNFTISSGTFTHNSGTVNFTGSTATLGCLSMAFNAVNFTGQTGVKTINSDCSFPLGAAPTIPNGISLSGTLSGTGTITNTTGSLTLNTGAVLSGFSGLTGTTNDLIISGATINFGSYNPVVIGGIFTLNSGTFTAPSGTMSVAGSFTLTSGTFTHNSGTISFTGGTATLSCNSVTFNIVNFTGQTGTKTVNSNCSLPIGANPTIPNSVTLSGTLSGTGTITNTTGMLTLNTGAVLSGFTGLTGTSNDLTIAGATFNMGSYTTANILGSFVISSGAFTAPAGTLVISGNFVNNGGTFTNNSGTINFNGGAGGISCGAFVFNLVTFTGQTGLKTISTSCALPLGANPTIPFSITLAGILSGTGTITQTTGTFTLRPNYVLTGFTGYTGTTNNMIVDAVSYAVNFGSFTTFHIGGSFNLTNGSFTAPSGTMEVQGQFTIPFAGSTNFTANGGTINFSGGFAQIACNNSSFNLVTFTGQTGEKQIYPDCSLPVGANPTIPNTLTLYGGISGSGTITQTTGILTLAPGNLSGFSGLTGTSNSLIIDKGAGTQFMSSWTPVLIGGDFTLTSGTFSAPTGTMTVSGNFSINAGTYTHNSGTVALTGGSSTITCGAATLSTVTINTSGTKTFSGACSTGVFNLTAGTMIAPSTTLTVSGNFTLSGGTTFTHNSGTISFPGSTATISCNNATFNAVNFTGQTFIKTVSSNCNLPLGASPTIPNYLTLDGTLSGSGTLTITTGNLTLDTGAVLSGFSGFVATNTTAGLFIAGANVNFGSYNPVTIAGPFYLQSGTFTAPTGTMSIGTLMDLTVASGAGTFNANGGTLNFNGNNTSINGCNGTIFNLVTFTGASGVITIGNSGSCNLPLGANPTIPTSITLFSSSSISGTGTITETTGTMQLGANGNLSGFTGLTGTSNLISIQGTINLSGFTTFVINSTASNSTFVQGTLTLPNGADLNGGLSLSNGTLNAPSGTINIAGALSVVGSSTINGNGGTIVFDTTVASTAFNCGTASLNNVQILATGAGTYIMGSDCTVNSFTITSGTWLDPALGAGSFYTLFIKGDFTETAATVFGGAHLAVQFTGTGLQNITKNAGTFSSRFYVFNTGIAKLTTAFVVTTQICQIYGSGSFMYTNGFAFTCAGGFTVLSGGTIEVQGAEVVTAPTLNAGSTVIYIGNGNAAATAYTLAAWTYTNTNLIINSTDGITDTFTINANITVASLTLTDGTIIKGVSQTLMTATTIIINGGTWGAGAITLTNSLFNCNAGTFTSASSTINGGTMNISGCAFTAPAGTLSLSGDFTYSSGTFTNSSGTIAFNGGNSAITCGSATLATVTFTLAGPKTFFSDCTTGAITATLGTIGSLGSLNLTANGLITVNGATWISGFNSITANAGITCSSGSMDSGAAVVDINGTLTISGCTYTASTGTTTISTNFTKTTGTFNNNSGIVTFDGGAQTITCGSAAFNTINITTAGVKTLSGTCTTGIFNMTAGTIGVAVTSPWTSNGLITINGATFSPVANIVTANAGVTCSSGSVTGGTATFNVTGTFLISGCTFTNGGNTISASSGISCTSGTFTGGAAALNINGDITINGCTFTAPSVTMSLFGNFTFASGTFNHNSGTILFDGGTQNLTCGTTTLNTATFNTAGSTGGTAKDHLPAVVSSNKIYYWGGFTPISNTMDIYDIPTSTWSTGATGGTARYIHSGNLYNGKIYYWGGFGVGSVYLNTMDIYTIATNTWTTGTAGGTGRYGQKSALYNGKIYYWGGWNGTIYLNTMSIYDIAGNSWTAGTTGGTARSVSSSAIYNGKIYFWGGSNGTSLNTMDIYDIAGNSWSTGATGGTARNGQSANLYNGKIYYWGGQDGAIYFDTTDIYDIAGNSWSTGASGGTARSAFASAESGGKIYSWGGYNGAFLNTMDIYDIASDGIGLKTIVGDCSAGIVNMAAGTIRTSGSPLIQTSGLLTVSGADFTTGPATVIALGITCSSGSMDSSSATSVDVNGTLTLSGCAFTAPNSTMTVSTNFTKTTGTFTAGTGVVTFDGGTQAVTCGSSTFNTVNFTTAGAKTLSGTCTTGIFNMTAGTIGMAVTSPWTSNGLITINGADFSPGANTITGLASLICSSGSIVGGTANFNITGSFNLSGCTFTNGGANIAASAGINCTSGTFNGGATVLNISSDLIINGCTFTAPSTTMNVFRGFTYISGTFNHNSGTIVFGGATQALTCGGTTLNTATFNSSGGTGGTTRAYLPGIVSNSKIYYWGGFNGTASSNTMDIYDIPSNTWSTGATGGGIRYTQAGSLYNGKIYYYGGFNSVSAVYLNTMDIYDIASNTWSTGLANGVLRGWVNSEVYNGNIYYWGGYNGAYLNTMIIYNIAGNTWSAGTTGGTAKYGYSSSLYNGKIYYWGGFNGAYLNTMDIYDIAGNSWTTGTAGGTARSRLGSSIYNGKIYTWGGFNGAYLDTMDIYDIVGNSWSSGPSDGDPKDANTSALYNGKIYNWGGLNGVYLNTMNIYDIATNTIDSKTINGNCTTGAINFSDGNIGTSGSPTITASGLVTVNGGVLVSGSSTVSANAGITCSSGTMDSSLATTVDVNGTLTISGCTFTAPATTMTISTNFTKTTGTFVQTAGTVNFDGGAQTITCGSATFNTLTISTAGVKTLSGTCTTGALNMAAGTIGMAITSPWTSNGLITISGGAFTPGANTINANAGITCSSGSFVGGTAVVNNNGSLLINGCTFTAPSVAMTVFADFTFSSGSFAHNSGTIAFDGATQNISCGAATLNTATLNAAGGVGGTARYGNAANLFNGKIYYWGGYNTPAAGPINTMDIYDIASNTWTTGLAGGTARYVISSALYNGKIYYWAGFSGGAINTMDIYDIASNTWSTGLAGGTARYGHTSVAYNGKIYNWGGTTNGTVYLNTMDIYDIAGNSWTTGLAGGTARYVHSSTLYNGKIYSWSGSNNATTGVLNTMDIYDIAGNSWTTGAAGGTGRYGVTSSFYNGKIYSWGGLNVAAINTMDIYDIAGNTWSTGSTGGIARYHLQSIISNGKMYLWGGYNGASTNLMDIYDIASDSYNSKTFTGNCATGALNLTAGDVLTSGSPTITSSGLVTVNGGNVTVGSGNITANAGITCSSGAIDSGSGTVDVNGTLTISGCAFTTTSPTALMTISTNFTKTTGSFIQTAGVVTFDGAVQGITCGGAIFNTVNITTAGAKTLTGTCATGDLNMNAGTIGLAVTSPLNSSGQIVINGAAFTPGANAISATNGVVCTSGSVAGGAALLYINSDLLINGCTFTAPSTTLSLFGSFTFSSGTFNHNSGTVQFYGATQSINCGSTTLNTATLNTAGGTGGVARYGQTSSLYNNKIYNWGGVNAAAAVINSIDIYDIPTNTWTTGLAGGTARAFHASVAYNGKIYNWGGSTASTYINTMDIYDIASNTWSTGLAGGTAKAYITSALYNGKIYYWAGHLLAGSNVNTIDIYDIASNTWSTGLAGGSARYGHSSNVYNGKIYSWGGYNGTILLNTVDIYDIAGNTWTTGAAGGSARYLNSSALYNGKIYYKGGSSAGVWVNTMDIYDIVGNSWSTGTAAGVVKGYTSAVVNNGKIYIYGGYDGVTTYNTTDIYDIASDSTGAKIITGNCTTGALNMNAGTITTSGSPTITTNGLFTVNLTDTGGGDTWSAGSTSPPARFGHTAVNYNNKAYIYGGQNGGTIYNTLYSYNYATNTWSSLGTGITARTQHAAVVFNDNMYVWGGYNGVPAVNNTMDIYNFTTGTWSAGTAGGTARAEPSAVVYNNKMYIWGSGVTSFDVYDFAAGTWSSLATTGGVTTDGSSITEYNNKIYMLGGSAALTKIYSFDFGTNTWTALADSPVERSGHTIAVYGNRLYAFNGYTSSLTLLNTVSIYNFITNTWSSGTTGGTARKYGYTTVYNGKAFNFFGDGGGALGSVDVYTFGADFTTGSATLNINAGLTCSAGRVNASASTSTSISALTISGCAFTAPITAMPVAGAVTCSSGSLISTQSSGIDFNGAFTVSGCVFYAPQSLTVAGAYTFSSGNIEHNNGTVTLDGSGVNLNSGCTNVNTCNSAFYNLTINKTLTTDTVTLLTNGIRVGNTLTITSGVLTQAALLNIRAEGAIAVTVGANGTWNNVLTGDVSLGGSVSNAGNITLEGTTAACAAEADAIVITSTTSGVQRAWSGAGTFLINDVSVQDQGGTANIAARSSTSVSGNGSNWFFLGCTTTAPTAPTSLTQKNISNTVISTGGWTNTIQFTVLGTDTDNPDGLSLCIEAKIIGVAFTNVEDGCGSTVSYTGTAVALSLTPSTPADNTYHWQARTKDVGGLYSTWVPYGANAESATDFGFDATAPTGGTVFDGTSAGVDVTFNGGSATSLSANWSGFDFTTSGISSYDYSIGTTIGGTDIVAYTTNGTGTSVTASGLTLQTLSPYYFNVRANDLAGNTTIVSSNGQYVTPSVSFSVSTNNITFNNLNNLNGFSDTKATTLTTSTNAFQGYVIRVYKTDLLRSLSAPAIAINDFSAGTYAAPAAWPVGVYGFGYTSNDTSLISNGNIFGSTPCLGGGNPPCYAPFSSVARGDTVADNPASVTGTPEQFIITYKVQTPNTQAPGTYTTTLIYSIVPHY